MSSQHDNPQCAQEIALTKVPFDTCSKCRRTLTEGSATLPGDPPVPVRGKTCPDCGRFYREYTADLEHYLAAHFYLQRYRSVKYNLWEYAREEIVEKDSESKHLHRLGLVPGAALLIVLQDEKGGEHEVFIVTDRHYEDRTKNVICWRTRTALVLLTYAFHKEHEGRAFTSKRKKYTVKAVYTGKDYRGTGLQAPPAVYLRKNGGLDDPEHPKFPRVPVLVYSPFAKHYVGMPVTHDTEEDVYYVDPEVFRKFIYQYGRPDVHIGFRKRTGEYGFDWTDPNDSSLPAAYGYSVGYKDNLPDDDRHELLAEIADLDLAPVSAIISHLNLCIASYRQNKSVVDCWKNDLEFISNYPVNPQRFLTLEKKKK